MRERLTKNRSLVDLSTPESQEEIREMAWRVIEEESGGQFAYLMLTTLEKGELLEKLLQAMFGLGILEPLLNDPSIKEIMINGAKQVFIERDGRPELARDKQGQALAFHDQAELMHVIDKIVSPINRKVDEVDPIVDGRLPDGSRVNIVIKPISLDGPAVTIRKFPRAPYTLEELVSFGALPGEVAEILGLMVQAKYNFFISGGTGSGKTTFLNSLSMKIPSWERLVTVEDAAELKLVQAENIVRLETRPPNIEGKGSITMRDLVRTALRMRPERIVVGEVRGGEALDMLQAMNTGHDGSLSTGHANSARDLLGRLETMVLMAGLELPVTAIRQQIVSAVDIVVHLAKFRDGKRRVAQITEIIGLEHNEILTQDLFAFQEQGMDIQGNLRGKLVPMKGIFHKEKFLAAGIAVPEMLCQELR
ncbi:MAG: CpaF family protein [Clostridia bacterium]|nr:CpaF family protein [Clostridia bacterium]